MEAAKGLMRKKNTSAANGDGALCTPHRFASSLFGSK